MSRGVGQRFSAGTRRQAVQILQDLIAAGVSDTAAIEQVAERFQNSLLRALVERAVVGVPEPVFRDGIRVGTVRRRSPELRALLDRLLS